MAGRTNGNGKKLTRQQSVNSAANRLPAGERLGDRGVIREPLRISA
jgi:hypothetical protein